MKSKGMVVKIKGSHSIVVARDGTYHRVPRAGQNIRVGQEIEFIRSERSRYLKHALMVASILVLVFSISLYQMVAVPATFAYVSLDINPSLELEVDKDLVVLDINALNPDAEEFLADMDLKGTDLYASIDLIVDRSVAEGLIKPGQKNYVLSTITLHTANSEVDEQLASTLAGELETTIVDKSLDVNIVVLSTDPSLRKEAQGKGLSTGKLAVYQEESAAGSPITLEDVKENSLTQLVKVGTVKLLPNNKKVIVKKVPVSTPANNGKSKSEREPSAEPSEEEGNKPDNSGRDNSGKNAKNNKDQGSDEANDTEFQAVEGEKKQFKDKDDVTKDAKETDKQDKDNMKKDNTQPESEKDKKK